MTTPNWKDAIDAANEAENERKTQELLDAANRGRNTGRSPAMTPQEEADLADYVAPGGQQRWKDRAKLDLDNRRANKQLSEEQRLADKGVTSHGDGVYTDRFGRECDSNGNRY